MDLKLIKRCRLYIKKKDRETYFKKREERINAIVKSLILDKNPGESIKMLQEIKKKFDARMDEQLSASLQAVEEISKYQKIK